ncbi:MAG: DUF350 domain-containing protein [Campylobacteraceae bacterium]|nr:DUF350 domain-containing protein [Campylobacteraceae bacterium]
MDLLIYFAQSMVYAVVVFLFFFLAKKIADKRVSVLYNADHEIVSAQNMAVSFRRAGLYLAIGIGMFAAAGSDSTSSGFIDSLLLQIVDGILIMFFLFCAMYINDKFILKNINNDEALKNNNIAVGLVEFGAYVATGLIAYGSFADTGPWYSSIVFFILGQSVLVVMVLIYEYSSKIKVLEEIKNGNIAAGLMVAGILIAYSLILKAAIIGPFSGWSEDLLAFAISAISGILLLLVIANKAIENIFLPNTDIYKEIVVDQDIPPIIVVVAVKITLALVIGAVVL